MQSGSGPAAVSPKEPAATRASAPPSALRSAGIEIRFHSRHWETGKAGSGGTSRKTCLDIFGVFSPVRAFARARRALVHAQRAFAA